MLLSLNLTGCDPTQKSDRRRDGHLYSELAAKLDAIRIRRKSRHRLDSIFTMLWTPAQEASALLGVEVGCRVEVVGSLHGSVVVF